MPTLPLVEKSFKDFQQDIIAEMDGAPRLTDGRIIYAVNTAIRTIADEVKACRLDVTFDGEADLVYLYQTNIWADVVLGVIKGYCYPTSDQDRVIEFFEDSHVVAELVSRTVDTSTEEFLQITLPENAPTGEYIVQVAFVPRRFTQHAWEVIAYPDTIEQEAFSFELHQQKIWWAEKFHYAVVLFSAARLWTALGNRAKGLEAWRDYRAELRRALSSWDTSSGRKASRIVQYDHLSR